MKTIFDSRQFIIFKNILFDTLTNLQQSVEENLSRFANALSFSLPYSMLLIGYGIKENTFDLTVACFVPPVFFVLGYLMRQYANRIGKSELVPPVPQKRFTECFPDGEVSVENARLQEMILYVADVEDWLKKNGITGK